jgi:NitT/TauT family transport system ATP-binding protein/sulfonate transport system ATP-binding protein
MQQRVAIARAYVTDPDLLIMDEPFGHLDAQTRYLMQGEIMRIWQQEHKTIVFITNNIEEAVFLASRIVVLSKLPASIKGTYDIALPHPRNLTDPEFLRLREMLTDMCEVTD